MLVADILRYATQASKAGHGATAEQLEADADRQAMVLWPLTVLGEAASHVSARDLWVASARDDGRPVPTPRYRPAIYQVR